MSIYDQDTDPSSPDARKQVTPEPMVTAKSPGSATTDPGVGPPSAPGAVRATGVVVPAGTPRPASVAARGTPISTPTRDRPKDSVELLLEGMGGPRPDRTKTTPQTGGEAAAAYHAEHSLRAGHAGHDEDMKVLVDTVRLPAAAETDELALRFAGEETYVLRSRLGPRVVVAALAGLLVVAAIFAFFSWGPGPKSTSSSLDPGTKSASSAPEPDLKGQGSAVAVPQAPAGGQAHTGAAVAAPDLPRPAEIAMPVAPAMAEPAPAAPPAVEAPAASAGAEAPAPAPATVASRAKSAGHARKSPDVGEFKTAF